MLTGTLPIVYARQKPWSDQVFLDDQDGNPLDLTGCDIRVSLYDGCHSQDAQVSILDIGIFEFSFPSVPHLCSGYYTLACDVTRDGTTDPIFRLQVPIQSEPYR